MNNRLRSTALAALVACGLASGAAFADDAAGRATAKVDDATVLAKIKTSLLRSTDVEGLDVNVDVRDGVVTLTGSADTANERATAERIATNADGVKRVNNRILIKQDNKAMGRPAAPAFTAPPLAAPIPSLGQTAPGQAVPGATPPPPAN